MKAGNSPLFTVVIPSWNRAHLVPRAIRSVLGQQLADFEVIVVDDGPDDETRRAVESFDDRRVAYVAQDHVGVASARNRGAALAHAPYITFLDSDDEALPGWLQSLSEAFKDPDVAVTCCGMRVHSASRREEVMPMSRGAELGGFTSLFQAGTFAVKTQVFHRAGGYWEELSHSENTELGFRLTALCREAELKIVAIHQALVVYHRSALKPETRDRVHELLANSERLLARHHRTLAANPSSLASFLSTAGRRAALLGDLPRARRYFARAVRADPRRGRAYARLLVSAVPPLARRVWSPVPDPEAVPC